jgi:MOSC domain-containing protein YiiM
MKVESVNVGLPREVEWRGELVRTSIWKSAVTGRVRIRGQNLDGDRQSDLSVHGGVDKAVYGYPSEHYAFWRAELGVTELPWGAFGENLTTDGLLEESLGIGDRVRIGTAELAVTQPRQPCFKLGIRHGRPDVVKRFQRAGRPGFYFAVIREGELGAGDSIEVTPFDGERITVAEAARAFYDRHADRALVRRLAEHRGLSEGWREHFQAVLEQGKSDS